MLERPRKLVVEPLHKRHDTARDLEYLSRRNGRLLIVVFPFLGVFDDNNFPNVLENVQQIVELLLCPGLN